MKGKKYHKRPTGWEHEIKAGEIEADLKKVYQELLEMLHLSMIKFEVFNEMAKKENKKKQSITAMYNEMERIIKKMEKQDV